MTQGQLFTRRADDQRHIDDWRRRGAAVPDADRCGACGETFDWIDGRAVCLRCGREGSAP